MDPRNARARQIATTPLAATYQPERPQAWREGRAAEHAPAHGIDPT